MEIDYGLYKKVFIFKNHVVKIPKINKSYNLSSNINCILECYTEKWYWLFSNLKTKNFLMPIIYIPLLPIVVQKRVRIVINDDVAIQFYKDVETILGSVELHMSDVKSSNLGIYDGQVVKIDYGFPYVFHNLFISLKNFLTYYQQ